MPDLTVPRFGWRRPWVPAHLRRRLLAALLAAAAALLALTSLHPPNPASTRGPTAGHAAVDPLTAGLRPDQVAAPVRLVDPQVGGLLRIGALVDVLAATQSSTGPADDTRSPARVIAQGVRVLAVPTSASSAAGSSGSTGSLVVLAVSHIEAEALAGAEAAGRLSVVLVA